MRVGPEHALGGSFIGGFVRAATPGLHAAGQLWLPALATVRVRIRVVHAHAGVESYEMLRSTVAFPTLEAGVSNKRLGGPAPQAELRRDDTVYTTGSNFWRASSFLNRAAVCEFEDLSLELDPGEGLELQCVNTDAVLALTFEWVEL